jgi:hypothetical protein
MTKYITVDYIREAIANDPRFDPNIELDEPGKVIVWLADGFTWNRLDDNRTVEGFHLNAHDGWHSCPPDTKRYWKERVAQIEEIVA